MTDESPNWLNNIVITTDGQLSLGGEIPIERIVQDKVAACEAAQAQ